MGMIVNPHRFGYATDATAYDGSADYGNRGGDLTGAANVPTLTMSAWFNPTTAIPSNNAYLLDTSGGTEVFLRLSRQTSTTYKVAAATGSGGAFSPTGASTFTVDTGWHHAILSFDRASGVGYLYVDDALEATSAAGPNANNLDLTHTDWFMGNHASLTDSFLNGCLSELFLHFGYMDLAVEANRRKFVTAGLDPVNLGADGSTPFGVQPIGYWPKALPSENLGSGGAFTDNGTLALCGSAP